MLASTEALYGDCPSVHARFPHESTPGEIWGCIDTSYPKKIGFRPIFGPKRKRLLVGHELPRNLVSSQIKYAKKIIHDGYDPQGRGLPEGIEGPDGTTMLLGTKQLDMAIYRAADLAHDSPNVTECGRLGYKVCLRQLTLLPTFFGRSWTIPNQQQRRARRNRREAAESVSRHARVQEVSRRQAPDQGVLTHQVRVQLLQAVHRIRERCLHLRLQFLERVAKCEAAPLQPHEDDNANESRRHLPGIHRLRRGECRGGARGGRHVSHSDHHCGRARSSKRNNISDLWKRRRYSKISCSQVSKLACTCMV